MSTDIIEEDFLDYKPTPINMENCRALKRGGFRQCKNKGALVVQQKRICKTHYNLLRRGVPLQFRKE